MLIMSTVSPVVTAPTAKRRRLDCELVVRSDVGTEIRSNGTVTPANEDTDSMDLCVELHDCPCGYLHGPGNKHFHDVGAVGFSANVMRGPD